MVKMKPIDFWGIRSIYSIDTKGGVYSDRIHRYRKAHIADDGYLTIKLYNNEGKRQNFRVNRLVARAYHGEAPSPDAIAEHIDNDPLNNDKDNIRWGNYSSNQYWHRKTKGVKCQDLSEDDIRVLCKMVYDKKPTREILDYFNIGTKKNDNERFNRFLKRISAIKRKKIYADVYEQIELESSTTISEDTDDGLYHIYINI